VVPIGGRQFIEPRNKSECFRASEAVLANGGNIKNKLNQKDEFPDVTIPAIGFQPLL